MCMPRRIIVRVAQKLNEKWHKELQHFEKMTDEIRVADSISAEIALDEELGDLAYQGLQACLAEGYRGWTSSEGVWRKEVEGVTATFDPNTRRLTLAASAADVITAAVEKRTVVSDRFRAELGIDVDLGFETWGNLDRVEALERQMKERLESDLEADKRAKIDAARARLRAEVKADMDRRWTALSGDKRRELGRLVTERLRDSRPQVECEMNLLLAESYKRALVLLAAQQKGKVTRDEESGSVIDLEITL